MQFDVRIVSSNEQVAFGTEINLNEVVLRKPKVLALYRDIPQSTGAEDLSVPIQVVGPFEQIADLQVFTEATDWRAVIEVVQGGKNELFQSRILTYLPAEFAVKDTNEDLRQFLQVVAVSMDEFNGFIEDFTTIFDPDKCPPKYLRYLAKLINYPLNLRNFDAPSQAVRDAAVQRARKQLRQAVEVYKRKGLKEAFQILFFSLGYYIELIELWTKNYITFVPEVPSNETLYHPQRNPNGWFKSPYFGIKLYSINQQTVCTAADDPYGQPWKFNDDDLQEVLDALHSIRPVHTVLHWLEYTFDLCDKYDQWDDIDFGGDISWEPTEEFFTLCQPDDPIYYRVDERLLGNPRYWVGGYDPDNYVSRNGTDALVANMVRDPQLGFCDPDLLLEIELGEINWVPDPWCSPITRDCGELYRNGYNKHPRNGEVPTRDPSCFEGRNAGYGDDRLAPFNEDSPNGLIYDRSGCYTPGTSSFDPLYQLADEAEDGLRMYYNKHEFKNWLDTINLGIGPDPDLTGLDTGTPPNVTISAVLGEPRQTTGSVVIGDGTYLYSVFGNGVGVTPLSLTKINFVSGLVSSASALSPVLPNGAVNASFGAAGFLNGEIHYYGGVKDDGSQSFQYFVYNIQNNTLTLVGDYSATVYAVGKQPAFAQVGRNLYMFGGSTNSQKLTVLNMENKALTQFDMPFGMTGGAAIAINEFIYLFGGTAGPSMPLSFYRFSTIDGTYTQLADAPAGTTEAVGITKGTKIMFFSASSVWSNTNLTESAYVEYDTVTSRWGARNVTNSVYPSRLSLVVAKAGRFYGTESGSVQVIDFIR